MLRKIGLFFIIVLMLLAGCNWPQDEELTAVDEPLYAEVESFLHFYKETFIEAVNDRSFNMIAPYLVTRSSFNQSVERYIEVAAKEDITKQLNTFNVHAIYVDQVDEIYADAYEKVTIVEKGEESIIEREVQFHLDRLKDESFRVVKVREIEDK